jgi:hypothetical protein
MPIVNEIYDAKRVTVRIWTSAGNPKNPGRNVGHVSVEANNKYISLWPKQGTDTEGSAKNTEGNGITYAITHELPSLEKDLEYEDRAPEVIYCFYSLDPQKIVHEFEAINKHLKGWTLLGLCENGESCASLAYRLVKAGGIGTLAGKATEATISSTRSTPAFFHASSQSSEASVDSMKKDKVAAANMKAAAKATSFYATEMGVGLTIKSPDFLAEMLKKAKQQELHDYPETKEIRFAGETPVSTSNRTCLLL